MKKERGCVPATDSLIKFTVWGYSPKILSEEKFEDGYIKLSYYSQSPILKIAFLPHDELKIPLWSCPIPEIRAIW